MIQVTNLTKSYGKQVLIEDATFAINSRERIGVIGRNGHGKSTLFRLLSGEEEIDSGDIHIPQEYRIGYLSQHLSFEEKTVLDEAASVLPIHDGSWKETYRAEAILLGLGFSESDYRLAPNSLSGGFQVRLNLAKLLLSEPNLLLLDEPTNYLDLLAMRWLEGFMCAWPHEMMLITHDRAFMDKVVTHTLGIHRTKVRKIEGSTGKFYQQIAQEEEIHEKSRANQEKKIKDAEVFIRSFRAKASKAKAVQSRIKALEKMETLEKLDEIRELDFRFSHKDFPGKRLLECKNISFRYSESSEYLFKDLSFNVGKKDRIAVIGKNGKGKSTLLRVLVGELKPDSGDVAISPNAAVGYFGQTNIDRLALENTIEAELLEVTPSFNRTLARTVAGVMMFESDDALKKIKVLSGGEKSRVMLGKILLTPSNLLVLDEPSNHLDMHSNSTLLEAVDDFPGAVLFVTHSEMFLHTLANRLIVFDGGEASLFEGTYQDFLRRRGWEGEAAETEEQTDRQQLSKKEIRRLRAEIIQRRGAELSSLQRNSAELESRIQELEGTVESETLRLIEISKDGFGDDAAKVSRELHVMKEELEKSYESLEQTLKDIEKIEARYQSELDSYS